MSENMQLRKAAKQSAILSVLNGATIALIFLIIGSFFMSVISSNRVARLYQEEMELTDAVQGYVDASADLTNYARNCAATGSITAYNSYETEVNVDKNREKNYDLMVEIGLTDSEFSMIDQMSTISNNLVPLEENAMNSALAGDTQSAITYVFGSEYNSNLDKIHSLQDQFQSSIDSRMTAKIQAGNDEMAAMQVCVFCFTLLAVLFQVFSIFFTRKKVVRPLKEVVVVLQELAGGNLSVECTVPEDTSELGLLSHYTAKLCHQLRDYIGDIQHNLSQMEQGNLNVNSTLEYLGDFKQIKNSIEQISVSLIDTLSEIDIAANEVASGAEQMSNGAQALSQGATQQASATEELTATVSEINQALIDANQAAIKASETAAESGHTANLCNDQMKELVVAMNDISNSTEQVNKIIKEIDDIAFQTNILALNAAVEAARAGSAGKGFAVVADEVRNLAGKSAESAKNTAQLIEACLTAVDRGANLVHATADRLQVVSNNSSEMAEMVKDIADTAQRSTDSVQQVSTGLDQISAVVQTNSATSEESAATSEELSAQAGLLKQLLSKFQFSTKEAWE